MDRINQPWVYGTSFNVWDYMDRICWVANMNITAINRRELGELQLMWFDITEGEFKWTGRIEVTAFWPKMNMAKKSIQEKNMFKVFDGEKINIIKGTVQVREFANDTKQIEAVTLVTAGTDVEVTNVTGIKATDEFLIIKGAAWSATVPAKVKVASVNTVTKVITFESPVTIAAGDYMKYITTDAYGCQVNEKTIHTSETDGTLFEYHAQLFTRKAEIENDDMEVIIRDAEHRMRIEQDFFLTQSNEMFSEVASQFKYGSGVSGTSAKIKGYDTIITEREADGSLESIIDFAADTTASEYQIRFEDILRRVNQAPVDSKFIIIANHSFHRAWKNMMQKLRKDADLSAANPIPHPLHDGILEWRIEEAPLVDAYLSDSLTSENPFSGKAYILPKDLCAGFTPRNSSVLISNWGKITSTRAQFGVVQTSKRANTGTLECNTYDHFFRLGFAWAGVSYRDTFFRIDNFDFGL